MIKLRAGDRIDCRVKLATIVSPSMDYDEIKTFEIVAEDECGYYLYVPSYYYLKNTTKADKMCCRRLGIDARFTDENIIFIQGNLIARVSYILDGLSCCKCKEFFRMAEANQDDGTLICYTCRFNPYR